LHLWRGNRCLLASWLDYVGMSVEWTSQTGALLSLSHNEGRPFSATLVAVPTFCSRFRLSCDLDRADTATIAALRTRNRADGDGAGGWKFCTSTLEMRLELCHWLLLAPQISLPPSPLIGKKSLGPMNRRAAMPSVELMASSSHHSLNTIRISKFSRSISAVSLI